MVVQDSPELFGAVRDGINPMDEASCIIFWALGGGKGRIPGTRSGWQTKVNRQDAVISPEVGITWR